MAGENHGGACKSQDTGNSSATGSTTGLDNRVHKHKEETPGLYLVESLRDSPNRLFTSKALDRERSSPAVRSVAVYTIRVASRTSTCHFTKTSTILETTNGAICP